MACERCPASDDDAEAALHECLSDFLAEQQPSRHELFVLKEAIYSMANDYVLMAYALWPLFGFAGAAGRAPDGCFDLWRPGVRLTLHQGGVAAISLPR